MKTSKFNSKFIIILASLVVLALLVAGAFSFYQNQKKIITESNQKELQAIAKLKIDQISNWYTDEMQDTRYICQNKNLLLRISRWIRTNDDEDKQFLINRLQNIQKEHGYKYLHLISNEGLPLLSSDNEIVLLDSVAYLSFIEAKKKLDVVCTDLYISNLDHEIHMDLISPILDSDNKAIAFILFHIDPNSFLYPFIQTWPITSKTAETLILRKENNSALFLNELKHRKNTALQLSIPIERKDVPAIYAISLHTGIFEGLDYRNEKVVSYVDSIPGTNWFMVSKIDRSELFENLKLNRILLISAIVAFILIFLMALGIVFTYRQKNLYKSILKYQREFKITLQSIGDGVITTDNKGLIQFMNPVAEKLTGWTEKEAINKSIEEVFVIRNEQTMEEVENPVKKVLKSGSIVGLANHTVLIMKEGTSLPIADSGAPIYDTDDKINGVVLVFRDQTKERNHQKEIIEQTRKLSTLLSNLLGMAYRCKNDQNWTMEFVSENCKELTGYDPDDFIGNKNLSYSTIIHPADKDRIWNDVQKALANRQNYQLEFRIITKSGAEKWVIEKGCGIYSDEGELEALEGFILDLTEKKKIEQELMESQQLFSTLSQNSSVGIFRTDSAGLTTYVNPKWCELASISFADAMGEGWLKRIHPDDRARLASEWERAKTNHLISNSEYRFLHPDGNIVYVKGQAVPEFNTENKLIGYIGNITDITELHLSLEALTSSEEKYRMLVDNQNDLVVRMDTENRFTFVSPSYCILFGKKEDELIGKSFMPLVHPEDIEHTSIEMAKLVKPPYTCYLEQRAMTKTGWRWLGWSDKAIVDENGNIISVIGVGRDITERKLATNKIESLSNILENSLNEIFIFSTDTLRFIYVNRGALANLGYSISEILELTPIEIKPEYNNDTFQIAIEPLLSQKKELLNFETIHQRKDGTTYPAEIYLQLTEYENQKVFVAMVRDLTQRKKIEEEIVSTNQLLRTIIDNIPDAIYLKDNEGRKLIANRADVLNCGGKEEKDIKGKNDFEMFPEEIASKFWADDYKVLKTGEPLINREEKLVNNPENTRWLLTSKFPFKDSTGNIIGTIGIGRDITEQKLAENETSKLSRAIIQSPVSIVITNPKGNIEFVNPKFTQVTGFEPEEVMGKNPRLLKSGFQTDEFYAKFWQTISSGSDWKGEFQNKKKSGELFWENAIVSPILDEEGKIAYYVAVKEDITEKKGMLSELIEAKEKAEQSDRLKTSFLANMSHEIRTPLNSILGFTSFIVAEDESLSKQEKDAYLAIINKSADGLLQIINDIIDISSLETGQLKINIKELNISELLHSLYAVFSKKLGEMNKGNIALKLVNGDKNIVINSDVNRLNQILSNLLSNASKFTNNGEIAFGIEKMDRKNLYLFVSDTGIGIKEDMQKAVFERFRQGEDTSTRLYGGNGLGLAIVKNLIEILGGEITLESKYGEGSKFKFYLPL